ncbi:MAG: patatin-like phospholipase family protein [marine benthic group bacterium]|nr:patatin-like phospholipase family protein [Gemmatimonadota bacterium]MCL7937355.1 patatin-like phospholipase family protein [Gemmatimonadota bacterium]
MNTRETDSRLQPPGSTTAVVLSGGGARGAYQVGVLRWIARQYPDLRIPVLTGVSAGAINAAYLAGRPEPLPEAVDRLAALWSDLSTEDILRADFISLIGNALKVALNLGSGGSRLAPGVRGLVDTSPLERTLARVLSPQRIAENIDTGRLHAVAVSATSYASGRTVTFVQAAEGARMWSRSRRVSVAAKIGVDQVMASSAIPLFFPAREVGGEWFGDGSLRQGSPLSPAVFLGADRILAVSSRYSTETREPIGRDDDGYPPAAQILGLMLNSIFLDNLDADAERLERINAIVARIPEEKHWLVPEREVSFLVIRPSSDLGRMAARHEAELPRTLRYLIRGLGSGRVASPDLLSYLMFEGEYLAELIRLGERDAERNWLRIRKFFEAGTGRSQSSDPG